MKRLAALFPIALALGGMMLSPVADAQAQGPTEIEKCQTISHPGSYKLVNNLTFKGNGTCLPITADFVTIDLGGFTISGPVVPGPNPGGGPDATAITAGDNSLGITVRNGSISGFTDGVNLPGTGSIVEGLRVIGGGATGITANGIVKGNTAMFFIGGPSAGNGIIATGIVTGNYASEIRARGIEIGQGSTVIGNTSTGNEAFGILVGCPSNVTDNTAVNNGHVNNGLGFNLRLVGDGCRSEGNVAP